MLSVSELECLVVLVGKSIMCKKLQECKINISYWA